MRSDHLISAEALKADLENPDLAILEATFFLPAMGRNAGEEFTTAHITGAQFYDIDAIADTASNLPHMLPDKDQFSEQIQKLGINKDSHIVVYDRSPFLSAARCWWMFRYFGHSHIHVLDGGYDAWLANGGAIETGARAIPQEGDFEAGEPVGTGYINLQSLRSHIADNAFPQILDARPRPRFEGTADEPRAGLPSGHMRGACNLPIMDILTDNGYLKAEHALKQLFTESKIDLTQPIITTCGSGVTAAGLTLALATLGIDAVRLYDGSWTEWASQPDADIVSGSA